MSKFLVDENLIPSEITDGHNPQKQAKDYAAYKKRARASKFKVFINPNVSYKGLNDDGRKLLAQRLNRVKNQLTTAFGQGQLIIDKGHGIPQLVDVQGTPEIGHKRGFIHIMIIYSFDEYCWLDKPKLTSLVYESLNPMRPRVTVDYLRDTGMLANAYVNKSRDEESDAVAVPDDPGFQVQNSGYVSE